MLMAMPEREMAMDIAPVAGGAVKRRKSATKSTTGTKSKQLKKVSRVRSDFRESWIWSEFNVK